MKSIYRKLVVYFLLLNLIAIGSIGIYSYFKEKEALLSRTFDQLISLRIEKKNRVLSFFEQRIRDIDIISEIPQIQTALQNYTFIPNYSAANIDAKSTSDSSINYLKFILSNSDCYTTFMFFDQTHNPIILNIDDSVTKIDITSLVNIKSLQHDFKTGLFNKKAYLKELLLDTNNHRKSLLVCKNICDKEKKFSGTLVAEINPAAINKIMFENNPNNGLSNTGEVYLVGSDSLMRSNSRFYKNSIFKTKVNTVAVQHALMGKTGYSQLNDYRNIHVLSAYSPLKFSKINWAVVAEIDVAEAMIPIYSIRDNIIYLSILIALLSAAVITFLSQKFSEPIKRLQSETTKIAFGQYGDTVSVKTHDEIGQLTKSFNTMSIRIKEQTINLENEKKLRLRSVIDAQEKERQRLSRELHDGLGPLLLTGKMKLEETLDADNKNINATIREVMAMFSTTIQEIRNISGNMMPSGLKEFGLSIALQDFCRQITESHHIKIICLLDLKKQHYEKIIDTYMFRIVQEAINNILKHANATEINLNFEEIDSHLFLTIRDNGSGFDKNSSTFSYGNGIINMKERVNLLNGYFDLTTSVGKGTTINIDISLS